MQIKAVTFDVGGTLIEPWPSVGHVYAEVAGRHGLKDVSPDLLNARFRAAWKARPVFTHSRVGWAELVDEVFLDLVPHPPSRTFFPALYERFAEPDAWHVFEDVMPTLDALTSRGIKLGVVSNWDERLRGLLRSLGLDRYFEALAISCEVGHAKPSPVIFEHAAIQMGLRMNHILHVGDSFEMDFQGAKAAGARALRIHRTASRDNDEVLTSLSGLAAKIEKREQAG